jgi:hypothetical protein
VCSQCCCGKQPAGGATAAARTSYCLRPCDGIRGCECHVMSYAGLPVDSPWVDPLVSCRMLSNCCTLIACSLCCWLSLYCSWHGLLSAFQWHAHVSLCAGKSLLSAVAMLLLVGSYLLLRAARASPCYQLSWIRVLARRCAGLSSSLLSSVSSCSAAWSTSNLVQCNSSVQSHKAASRSYTSVLLKPYCALATGGG